MLRAAMSIPANIVEGSGHESGKEFVRFLRIASASASELEYHLLIAKDFGILSESDFASLSAQASEVRKMLFGLIRYLAGKNERAARSKQLTE
jgi:four helix bundle protein